MRFYIACFTEVMGYDLEAEFDCPDQALEHPPLPPLAEFLGVDEGVFEGATLTASRLDCEAGYIDIEIDEEETRGKDRVVVRACGDRQAQRPVCDGKYGGVHASFARRRFSGEI